MKKILFVLLITPFFSFSQNQINAIFEQTNKGNITQKKVAPFALSTSATSALNAGFFKEGYSPTFLEINTKIVQQVDSTHHLLGITVPTGIGQSLELELFAVNIYASGFKVLNSAGIEVPYTKGLHFQGRIKGDNTSIVGLSINNGEIAGFISDKTGNRTLEKLKNQSIYSLYYDDKLLNQKPIVCHVNDNSKIVGNDNSSNATVGCKIVSIYIEADNQLYISNGSNSTTTANYVSSIFNQVATIYKNENIAIQISTILIWDVADPYDLTSTATVLGQMQTRLGTTFNGNLAHLFSGKNLGGGIAYVDVLCSKAYAFGVSVIPFGGYYNGGFSNSPVGEIAHELGHNFGSGHTHGCIWNGNNTAIDNCGPAYGVPYEGSCSGAPTPAAGGGTVMSYCHLLSTIGINLSNGFGTQPGDLIRARVSSCNQISVSNAIPTSTITTNITTNSATVSWITPLTSTSFTVRYRVVGSSTWSSLNTTGTSINITGLTSGVQYEWQVTGDCSNSVYTSSINFTTTGITATSVASLSFCQGNTLSVNYTIGGTFNAGNIFTAQLSNNTGSFATPTNIGTVNATTSGVISCTIPTSTAVGTGYRIRITTTNPVVIGNDNGLNITVNSIPVQPSIFTASSPTVCQGTINVTYTIPAVATATGYTWTYSGTGHTITGSGTSVTVSFSNTATSGTLSVTANNTCGSSTARTVAITVNQPATASLSGTRTIIIGQTANLSVSLTGTSPWSVVVGGTTYSSVTASPYLIPVTPNITTTYALTNVSNTCGSVSITNNSAIVTVSPQTITTSITGTTFCAGVTVTGTYTTTGTFNTGNTFTAQLSDALGSFTSPVGLGAVSGGTISVIIPANSSAGTGYRIRVISSNPVINGTVNSANLTINPLPAQLGAFTVSTASVCQGQNAVVYTVPPVAGATSYTWTYTTGTGASFSSTTNSVSVNFLVNATSGSLNVVAVNACGQSIAQSLAITVNSSPAQIGAFTASTATVCQGQNAVTYTVPFASTTNFLWSYSGTGASFSGLTNSIIVNFSVSATSGTLSVSANNGNCGNSIARTLAITVDTPPTIPTTTQSGDWNNVSTWKCGVVPTIALDAIIGAGNTITIDGILVEIKSLVNNGGILNFLNNGSLKLNN